MDDLPDSGSNVVTGGADGGDGSGGTADRDLRDVLAHLVVTGDGHGSVSVTDVAAAVDGSERLLPELIGALTDDVAAVRIGAAWTLCALADEQPAVVEYLTERVVERMDDGDEPFEVGQVLAFLRGRYPGRAGDAVDVAVDRSLEPDRADGGTPGSPETPAATRVETDGGVPAGAVADLGNNRQVVRPDGEAPGVHQRPVEPDEPGWPDDPRAGPSEVPVDHPTHPDFEPDDGDADGNAVTGTTDTPADAAGGDTTTPDPTAPPVPGEDRRPETPETFASVAALSGFDRLVAIAEGVDTRYAAAYRCRAARDDAERGVSVRLFDRVEECDRLAFCSDLEDSLARWQALGSGDHVVGVVEWGDHPRPWVITEPVEGTLVDRDRPPVDGAFRHALRLAEAVDHLHRHGVVHAGIEPRTVVYPCDTLEATPRPMLDSVGLMGPFREYFEPAEYLDPRFAAPEYFDDSFGCVDAATDVYGLGAVCYLLLTGRPPVTGSFAEVRRRTLRGTAPDPSTVNGALPGEIDDVLTRALAPQKLTRYESVGAFRRDIERMRERSG